MNTLSEILNFFSKYKAFSLWLIAFVLDQQYQILEVLMHVPAFYATILRGLGATALAYFTNKKLSSTKNIK